MKLAIIKNWSKYGFDHVMCGFIDPTDFDCFTSADVTFGDGSGVTVTDRSDVIITDIDAEQIEGA